MWIKILRQLAEFRDAGDVGGQAQAPLREALSNRKAPAFIWGWEVRGNAMIEITFHLVIPYIGTPEKSRSTAAKIVSAIKTR